MKLFYCMPEAFLECNPPVYRNENQGQQLRRAILFLGLIFLFIGFPVLSFASSERKISTTTPMAIRVNNLVDTPSTLLVKNDLVELKKHVNITKQQEDSIYNLFLSKYQYLEIHAPNGGRWELIKMNGKRKLKELLGDESYQLLDGAGLIIQWFDINEDQ